MREPTVGQRERGRECFHALFLKALEEAPPELLDDLYEWGLVAAEDAMGAMDGPYEDVSRVVSAIQQGDRVPVYLEGLEPGNLPGLVFNPLSDALHPKLLDMVDEDALRRYLTVPFLALLQLLVDEWVVNWANPRYRQKMPQCVALLRQAADQIEKEYADEP